jgi:chromosome segregation ATPase
MRKDSAADDALLKQLVKQGEMLMSAFERMNAALEGLRADIKRFGEALVSRDAEIAMLKAHRDELLAKADALAAQFEELDGQNTAPVGSTDGIDR